MSKTPSQKTFYLTIRVAGTDPVRFVRAQCCDSSGKAQTIENVNEKALMGLVALAAFSKAQTGGQRELNNVDKNSGVLYSLLYALKEDSGEALHTLFTLSGPKTPYNKAPIKRKNPRLEKAGGAAMRFTDQLPPENITIEWQRDDGDVYTLSKAETLYELFEAIAHERGFEPLDDEQIRVRRVMRSVNEAQQYYEIKMPLSDPGQSAALQAIEADCSFAETMARTVPTLIEHDIDKESLLLPEMPVNHFPVISAIYLVTWPGAEGFTPIGHIRRPADHKPENQHTKGLSVLFSRTVPYRVWELRDSIYTQWKQRVASHGTAAAADMTCPPDMAPAYLQGCSVLTHLMGKYFGHIDAKMVQKPFGVATRDERKEGNQRVYTHFIFTIEVHLDHEPFDPAEPLRNALRNPDTEIVTVDLTKNNWEADFEQDNGRRKEIDIVALQGWLGQNIDSASATFRKGFRVV